MARFNTPQGRALITPGTPHKAFTPAAILPRIPLWVDFGDQPHVSVSGGTIFQAANKGARAGTFSQVTTACQPAAVAGGLNGYQVAQFDGSNDQLYAASDTYDPTTLYYVGVAKRSNTTSQYSFQVGINNGLAPAWIIGETQLATGHWAAGDFGIAGNGSASTIVNAAANPFPVPVTDTTWHIWRAQVGTTSKIFVDGTEVSGYAFQGTGDVPLITGQVVISGGKYQANGATGDVFKGSIAEWIIGFDLQTGEPEKLEGYVAWKFGLQGQLPSGHAYKNSPP